MSPITDKPRGEAPVAKAARRGQASRTLNSGHFLEPTVLEVQSVPNVFDYFEGTLAPKFIVNGSAIRNSPRKLTA